MKLKDILDTVLEDIEKGWMKQFAPGQVYSNPYHTSFNQINEGVVKTVIIMVGLPGSGKSTFIKKLPTAPVICSADNYFETPEGGYNFDATKLGNAHTQCRNKAALAMHQQKPTIVIDNTNLTDKEREPYETLAEQNGYKILYVVFEPNKQNIKKLAQRNLHGVEAAKLEVMLKRFRPPSGEKGKIIFK